MRALVAAPAAPVLLAQQTAPVAQELPKLEVAPADQLADSAQRFFTQPEFAAFRKLCDLLTPGSLDAGVPEFLDFLVSQSSAEKQQAYRAGLDLLNAGAKKSYSQAFADLNAAQADKLLAPLHSAWTYVEPSDPLARFLREAKADVRTATMNSREFSANSSNGGRRGGANGLYFYPLD